jgi:arginine:pyruvate transaminase
MLFGSQPFIADMTAEAVSHPSPIAAEMMGRFQRRAAMMHSALHGVAGLHVHVPQAGMFAVVDVRSVCASRHDFAVGLLEAERVAVMPGESFGTGLAGWLRISLTQDDARIAEAAQRIARYALSLKEKAA